MSFKHFLCDAVLEYWLLDKKYANTMLSFTQILILRDPKLHNVHKMQLKTCWYKNKPAFVYNYISAAEVQNRRAPVPACSTNTSSAH